MNQLSQTQKAQVLEISPALRMLYNKEKPGIVVYSAEASTKEAENVLFTTEGQYVEAFLGCKEKPTIVAMENIGTFSIGESYCTAKQNLENYYKGNPAMQEETEENWKRLDRKITIVTGGAQGFGEGIARAVAKQGGYLVIADLNLEGAVALAEEVNAQYGEGSAVGVKVDVSNEESVKNMVETAVFTYGGLDLMISNAGIAIAGDLAEQTAAQFNLVTSVNYLGYFLCAKYAAVPMKIQQKHAPEYWADIIEVNSKSGLVGSKKNFAYAGSKFGGIGLTQSFALELAEYNIKVNAVCPGNFLDGPLWANPEKGLFKQYFEAGKVPGAKSIEDVRKHYESLVPIGRGCTPEDIATAIFYLVEQKYETGQALPVTGGQVMLK